ncbi:MAG: HlyD family efflux transporter periplasmic adaptor subunit [Deltaproteobacteria bacterium]|nr:MAG: HlyD family efflux transporter periplasmic adaptor subunit [Deltaproteobacteria bacterium]
MDRIIKKKKLTPNRIIGIFIVSGFLAFCFYQFVLGDYSAKLNVKTERITISAVKEGPFQEYIPVIGTVVPKKTIYLDAMEGGSVEKVYIEAGSFVKKGEKILTLANTDLLLDIMNREAEFFQLTNDLRNARLVMEQNRLSLRSELLELDYQINKLKRTYESEQALIKNKIIPSQQYENTKSEYEYLCNKREITLQTYKQDSLFRENQIQQIETSLKRMEANLKIVKQKLEDLTIKAPIAGHLTALNDEIGESKKRGERLGQIDVLDGFKILVPVDEHYIARINTGQHGEFTFDEKHYQLTIAKIYPEVIDGRFEIDMVFDGDQPEDIRRGQTLHIKLELGNLSTAILLPQGGFYQKTGGQWVYVLENSGEFAVKRKINLGRQNPEVYEVLAGLKPGERVITSSYDNYGDNIDKLVLK